MSLLLAAVITLTGCDALSALRGSDGAKSSGSLAASGDPLHGQRLMAQYQCGRCHVVPNVPESRGKLGPSLAAFGSRSYIAGHIPNRPDVLARFIMAPSDVVPGTPMPSMGVSSPDARDIVAYLSTLR